MALKIAVGSDHGGFELKAAIIEHLEKLSCQVEDFGASSAESSDYPDFAAPAARSVQDGQNDLGVLICGSGIGMSITANRFPGVRAALAPTTEHARLGRQHNKANVLCLGERLTSREEALKILDVFLNTEFEGGRHERRIQKIDSLTGNPA